MITAIIRSRRLSGTTMQKKPKPKRRQVHATDPTSVRAFETEEAAAHYLSGDRITCLLCGGEYVTLGVHLPMIHGIDVVEYHKMYNIPLGMPLMTQELVNTHRKNGRRPEHIAKMKPRLKEAYATRRTPQAPRFFTAEQRAKKRQQAYDHFVADGVEPITDEMILEYERLVLVEGCTITEAANRIGRPYQTLNYGRKRMAKDKGLPPPKPFTAKQKRVVPAHLQCKKQKYKKMTAECVAEVEHLIETYQVTRKEAFRSLGWPNLSTANSLYWLYKKQASQPPPEPKEEWIPAEDVAKYEHLVRVEGIPKTHAAKSLGYHYKILERARARMAEAKGLSKPLPLVSVCRKSLPVASTPKYPSMTPECIAEIDAIVARTGISVTEVIRSFGFPGSAVSWKNKYLYRKKVGHIKQ